MAEDLNSRIRAVQETRDQDDEEPHGREPASLPRPTDVSLAALSLADALLGGPAAPVQATSASFAITVMGRTLSLSEGEAVVIGRGADADVAVADARVSRRHLAVEIAEGWAVVTDVGSRNGTEIRRGGTRLLVGTGPEKLQDGDVLCTVDNLEIANVRIVEALARD